MALQSVAANQAANLTAAIQAAIQAALPPQQEPAQPAAAQVPQIPAPILYTVKGMVAAEPALTVGGLRDDLLHRQTNGLAATGAVIRRGRLLLIHREKYLSWLLTRGTEQAA